MIMLCLSFFSNERFENHSSAVVRPQKVYGEGLILQKEQDVL
jgi:hypothetical protein